MQVQPKVSQAVMRTIIAEALGEGSRGMQAVAEVIRNRASEWGMTPEQVVTQRGQFTGYSHPGRAAKAKFDDPDTLAAAQQAWDASAQESILPAGALYYYSGDVAPTASAPLQVVATIGNHRFLAPQGANVDAAHLVNKHSKPEVISALQQSLSDAGFDPGGVDGKLGPNTKAALRAFQQAHGLKADGIAGPNTMGALGRGPAPIPRARPDFQAVRPEAPLGGGLPAALPPAPPMTSMVRPEGPLGGFPAAATPPPPADSGQAMPTGAFESQHTAAGDQPVALDPEGQTGGGALAPSGVGPDVPHPTPSLADFVSAARQMIGADGAAPDMGATVRPPTPPTPATAYSAPAPAPVTTSMVRPEGPLGSLPAARTQSAAYDPLSSINPAIDVGGGFQSHYPPEEPRPTFTMDQVFQRLNDISPIDYKAPAMTTTAPTTIDDQGNAVAAPKAPAEGHWPKTLHDEAPKTVGNVTYDLGHDTMEGMKPEALSMLNAASSAGAAAGLASIRVLGAMDTGARGHKSHYAGTELDITGINPDGSLWSPEQRVQVAGAAASVGGNRFGFYTGPHLSLHMGIGTADMPHNVAWGPNNQLTGVPLSSFNPAEQGFVEALRNGTIDSYVNAGPEEVTKLQQALNENGAGLTIDGHFGPSTAAALASTQNAGRIRADLASTSYGLHSQANDSLITSSEPPPMATPTSSAFRPEDSLSASVAEREAATPPPMSGSGSLTSALEDRATRERSYQAPEPQQASTQSMVRPAPAPQPQLSAAPPMVSAPAPQAAPAAPAMPAEPSMSGMEGHAGKQADDYLGPAPPMIASSPMPPDLASQFSAGQPIMTSPDLPVSPPTPVQSQSLPNYQQSAPALAAPTPAAAPAMVTPPTPSFMDAVMHPGALLEQARQAVAAVPGEIANVGQSAKGWVTDKLKEKILNDPIDSAYKESLSNKGFDLHHYWSTLANADLSETQQAKASRLAVQGMMSAPSMRAGGVSPVGGHLYGGNGGGYGGGGGAGGGYGGAGGGYQSGGYSGSGGGSIDQGTGGAFKNR